MAKKLQGFISLTKIPKSLIKQLNSGDKGIYIDVVERMSPSEKGFTHYVSVWNSEKEEKIYLGNLKPVEIVSKEEKVNETTSIEEIDDLPFDL